MVKLHNPRRCHWTERKCSSNTHQSQGFYNVSATVSKVTSAVMLQNFTRKWVNSFLYNVSKMAELTKFQTGLSTAYLRV